MPSISLWITLSVIFELLFMYKGQNGVILPVKVFRSRSLNGIMTKLGSFAMNIGGEIHIGPEMHRDLLQRQLRK